MDGWYRRAGVGLLCMAGWFMGGCGVAQTHHDAVIADLESSRADLERSRKKRRTLKRENEQLRTEHEKAALNLEVMGSEIQRIKESHERERALLDMHDAELGKVTKARTRQLRTLQRDHRKLQKRARTLRGTVRRYQKELKESRESLASRPSDEEVLTASMTHASASTGAGAAGLVNLNTASVRDFVAVLGLSRLVAERVVANRPYRLRGELLAKRVVPDETFEVIKDRVTAETR